MDTLEHTTFLVRCCRMLMMSARASLRKRLVSLAALKQMRLYAWTIGFSTGERADHTEAFRLCRAAGERGCGMGWTPLVLETSYYRGCRFRRMKLLLWAHSSRQWSSMTCLHTQGWPQCSSMLISGGPSAVVVQDTRLAVQLVRMASECSPCAYLLSTFSAKDQCLLPRRWCASAKHSSALCWLFICSDHEVKRNREKKLFFS